MKNRYTSYIDQVAPDKDKIMEIYESILAERRKEAKKDEKDYKLTDKLVEKDGPKVDRGPKTQSQIKKRNDVIDDDLNCKVKKGQKRIEEDEVETEVEANGVSEKVQPLLVKIEKVLGKMTEIDRKEAKKILIDAIKRISFKSE